MKGSEFVKLLLEKVGVDNDEINAFATAGALQEIEISDEAAEVVKSADSFNFEVAKNNPDISKYWRQKLKREYLDQVDEKVMKVAAELFNNDQISEIKSTESTPDRVEKLGALLTKVIEEKTDDSKTKETIAKYREQVENLNKTIQEKESGFQQELSKREEEFKNNLLKRDVYSYTTKYEFQEPYRATDQIRKSIDDIIWHGITSEAVPKYNEKGEIEVYRKDDPELLLYENNKQVKIDELVAKYAAPYVKKSDPPAPKGDEVKRGYQQPGSGNVGEIKDPMLLDRLRKVGQL